MGVPGRWAAESTSATSAPGLHGRARVHNPRKGNLMPTARARRSTCNACTRPATVFMADFRSKIHRRLCERDAESTPLLEIPEMTIIQIADMCVEAP